MKEKREGIEIENICQNNPSLSNCHTNRKLPERERDRNNM
jgi:hypothetical protein